MYSEPKYDSSKRKKRKYTHEVDEALKEILKQEETKTRVLGSRHKQKLTNKQIHEKLLDLGHDIGRVTINKIIAKNTLDNPAKTCYNKNIKTTMVVHCMVTLKDIIKLAKELPEEAFAEIYDIMGETKRKVEEVKKSLPVACPNCGNPAVKNGKKDGSQSFLCKTCKRSFLERATSAIAHSHSSKAVWKAVIDDTIHGISIKRTADDLELSRQTVFNIS
jgi:transposase-like protein